MVIQPIASADITPVVALWQEVGLIRPWNDPQEDLRRALAGPSSTVLAGSEDGLLVATAMVGHDGHRGWVYYLAVRPKSRRRGHGATMMRACEQWLKERGVPKLNVMVRGDNADAHGFYVGINYARDDVAVLSRRLD
jgi:ribosomal protein S18 acetylase RimI-like enzyme